MITVNTVPCPGCGEQHEIKVPVLGLQLWRNGEAHIQDALPMLGPDEREMLMTGYCGPCWDRDFKEEE